MKGYNTSRNYHELYRIVNNGNEVIGFTNYDKEDYITKFKKKQLYISFSIGCSIEIPSYDEDEFIKACHKYNVEYIHPILTNEYERKVFDAIYYVFGVRKEDMIKRTRKREIIDAKHAAVHVLLKRRKLTQVANEMKRHHASIINSRKEARNLIAYDKEYKAKIDTVINMIK